jgi:hypothetical protein
LMERAQLDEQASVEGVLGDIDAQCREHRDGGGNGGWSSVEHGLVVVVVAGWQSRFEAALRRWAQACVTQCSGSKLPVCQIPSGLWAGEAAGASAFLIDRLSATSAGDGLPAPLPQFGRSCFNTAINTQAGGEAKRSERNHREMWIILTVRAHG